MFRLLLASTSANQVQQQFKEWPVDGTLQQNFTDWDLLNLMNKIMEDSGWENLRLYLCLWLMMMLGQKAKKLTDLYITCYFLTQVNVTSGWSIISFIKVFFMKKYNTTQLICGFLT